MNARLSYNRGLNDQKDQRRRAIPLVPLGLALKRHLHNLPSDLRLNPGNLPAHNLFLLRPPPRLRRPIASPRLRSLHHPPIFLPILLLQNRYEEIQNRRDRSTYFFYHLVKWKIKLIFGELN